MQIPFNALKTLVRKVNLDCIFLMETKLGGAKMEHICRKLNFSKFTIVNTIDGSGGLALLWHKKLLVSCVWKSARVICCSIANGSKEWMLYGCHATPYNMEKASF